MFSSIDSCLIARTSNFKNFWSYLSLSVEIFRAKAVGRLMYFVKKKIFESLELILQINIKCCTDLIYPKLDGANSPPNQHRIFVDL